MLKKSITYESLFTGEQVTEDHYFHISKADLVTMEMEEHKATHTDKNGKQLTGMQARLTRIVEAEDGKGIMQEFREIIRRAYGKKDGNRFMKSQEIWDDFAASEAYSELIYELCTNADEAANFVKGILPGNLDQLAAEAREEAKSSVPAIAAYDEAAKKLGDTEPKVLTRAEAAEMDSDELASGLTTGKYKLA